MRESFQDPTKGWNVDGANMYEWVPATIVAGTFLVGVAFDALETGWWTRLKRH